MKSISLVPIISLVLTFSVIPFAGSARGGDALDAQIQRLREGKDITISDTEFKKIQTEANDKYFTAAAELYIQQVKWSLISPESQVGWPYRSTLVSDPDMILRTYQKLKELADRTGDALLDYALICPTLYLANEQEVTRILIRLEKKDHFLYDKADTYLEFWREKIADMMRGR